MPWGTLRRLLAVVLVMTTMSSNFGWTQRSDQLVAPPVVRREAEAMRGPGEGGDRREDQPSTQIRDEPTPSPPAMPGATTSGTTTSSSALQAPKINTDSAQNTPHAAGGQSVTSQATPSSAASLASIVGREDQAADSSLWLVVAGWLS